MAAVRTAVVAGSFYPADPGELTAMVRKYLTLPQGMPPEARAPKALIAPHAGYVYSGAVAGMAYARLWPVRHRIRRVVLVGPSHRVGFRGLAVSHAEAYETPLGLVPVDLKMIARVPGVGVLEAAHAQEHSLEVHLLFLQEVLESFTLVPVVAGDAEPEDVAAMLEAAWGGAETLVVVSTDLSHYLDYDSCRRLDATTVRAIESADAAAIGRDQACGRVPVRGLLVVARRKGLSIVTLNVCNSGDTAGPRDRVVGYGAWALLEPEAGAKSAKTEEGETMGDDAWNAVLAEYGQILLHMAAASIRHGLYYGRGLPLDLDSFPPALHQPGAVFVTLNRAGQLRGCIGSPQAWRPLAEDVADNAYKAAFADPRFRPVLRHEVAELEVSVSLLTPPPADDLSGRGRSFGPDAARYRWADL